jgi:hypothetical protein
MKKVTNGNMMLYAPARFAVSTTGATGWSVRGFRIEDPKREALAAIVETSSKQIGIPDTSPHGFTSPVFAQEALRTVIDRVERNITGLLPQASPFEESGDWSIEPVEAGIFRNAAGNIAIMGRYRFEYVPVYQLRSVDVFQFLARVLVGQRWGDFPRNTAPYFPAGRNIIFFSVGIVFYEEDGFYSSENTSRRVAVSFGVAPDNKSTNIIWDDLDDILTFKTYGNIRDSLVTESTSIEVPEAGNAVDVLLAIDRGGNMVEEAPVVKSLISELVNRLVTESDYSYRVGLLTQGNGELTQFSDGRVFLDPGSANAEALAGAALDEILHTADGSTAVDADLNRTTALAVTGEALSGINGGFRRTGAPLLLVTITDRDDASPALDGTLLPAQNYTGQYLKWLAHFDHWIVLAPRLQGCNAGGINSAQGASLLLTTAARRAGETFDWCSYSRTDFLDSILTWAAVESSLFKFDAPQPFPFTLALSINGRSMKRGVEADYNYDVFGDRLVFQSTVAPQAGDTVRVRYQRLQPFRAVGNPD